MPQPSAASSATTPATAAIAAAVRPAAAGCDGIEVAGGRPALVHAQRETEGVVARAHVGDRAAVVTGAAAQGGLGRGPPRPASPPPAPRAPVVAEVRRAGQREVAVVEAEPLQHARAPRPARPGTASPPSAGTPAAPRHRRVSASTVPSAATTATATSWTDSTRPPRSTRTSQSARTAESLLAGAREPAAQYSHAMPELPELEALVERDRPAAHGSRRSRARRARTSRC